MNTQKSPMDNISTDEPLNNPTAKGGVDWMEYLFAVKKHLWLVVLTTVLGVGWSIVQLARTTPVYAAKAVLLIEQRAAQVVRMEAVDQADARYLDVMNTLVETMRSRTLLQRVVDNLNLQDNPDFLPKNANGLPHTKEEALNMLCGCVKTNLRKNTRLVDIYVEHANPETARMLADSVSLEFIRSGNDQRLASSQSANEYINEELSRLQAKLHRSEEELQKFPELMRTGPMEQNQDIVVDRLKDLNARFSAARAERLALETERTRAIENANNPEELLKLPSVAGHPIVAPLLATLADKESQLAVLRQQYKSKHPKYITAVAEVESMKASLYQKAMEASQRISTSCSIARDQEEELSKSVNAQEKVLSKRNQDMLQYNVLKRAYDADCALYESMKARMNEIDVTKGVDGSPIKIIDPAIASGVPVRPQKMKTLFIGGFLGMIIGLIGAIGTNRIRRQLRTVDQVESLTGFPVLGAMMKLKKTSAVSDKDFLLKPEGMALESIRALQTAISIRIKADNSRTMMVTSAIPGEGKTYISINLAAAFAHARIKTLLIDADMRKKTCSSILGDNTNNLDGLSELMEGRVRLEDVVQATEVPNLYLVAAGKNRRNPAEWLTPESIRSVIESALKEYDQIIIDTPPVLAVSDSLLIATEVQTVCYVVGSMKVCCTEVERACKLLSDAHNPPIGMVLNFLEKQFGEGGYYYGDYYGKGYGEPIGKS